VQRAVAHLAERLRDEYGRQTVRLRLGRSGRYARLDLGWVGPPVTSPVLDRWTNQPLASLGSGVALTVSEVLQRHGGEIWPGEDTDHVYLRLLLPLDERPRKGPSHSRPVESPGPAGSPGAYDFSLLEPAGVDDGLGWDARPLDRITYTVFDTETTGLFPAEGDELISVGALRVVNARLLRQESYEQLIDPRRTVPESSVRIHGITADLLHGMPTVDQVLPRFAAFAADTVLVGHNVAFDLQFLRAKERVSGVRFDQPVLDTLLLSAVVHPEHESHTLEAIAERLGIDVIGRHTALGDAIVTGEIFLRLLELLKQRGIRTLGEARAAARATAAARFSESLYTHR
jgi:DNA polymerase-3 subunit epsilon